MLQDFKGNYIKILQILKIMLVVGWEGGLTAILAGQQATIPQLQAEIEQLRSTQKNILMMY